MIGKCNQHVFDLHLIELHPVSMCERETRAFFGNAKFFQQFNSVGLVQGSWFDKLIAESCFAEVVSRRSEENGVFVELQIWKGFRDSINQRGGRVMNENQMSNQAGRRAGSVT